MSKVKKSYYLNGLKTKDKPQAKLIGVVEGFYKGKVKTIRYKEEHYEY